MIEVTERQGCIIIAERRAQVVGYLYPPTGNYVRTHPMIYSPRCASRYAFHLACVGDICDHW